MIAIANFAELIITGLDKALTIRGRMTRVQSRQRFLKKKKMIINLRKKINNAF